jgi:energy-coupling factor transport system permease protein
MEIHPGIKGKPPIPAQKPQRHVSNTFGLIHPGIQLGYLVAVLVFCMAAMHPVYLALSFLGALSFGIYTKGLRRTCRPFVWQAPFVLLIVAVNPLFSSVGSTELFRMGTQAVYLESYVFGACMALMLVTVLLWFSNAEDVLTVDKVGLVLGNAVPTIALIVSLVVRLVPLYIARGRLVDQTLTATSAARPRNAREMIAAKVRLTSVLMGWNMEDSLVMADAMRARGWGAAGKRTNYQRFRLRHLDVMAALMTGVLVALNAALAVVACSQYHFYPTMSTLIVWWGYVPYILFAFLPLIVCVAQDAQERLWMR